MIENDLREAFGRREESVPDAMALVPKINEGVRRRRRQRLVVRSTSVVVAVILVAVGLPIAGRAWLASQIPQKDLIGTDTTYPSAPLDGRPLNFLLLGLDHRAGSRDLVRSDAIIVAHVPADRSALYLITIPRDLSADVPGVGQTKLNEAYAHGGVAATARTLKELAGLRFDGAATVEYAGFRKVIAAFGGLNMCVDERVESDHYDANGRYVGSTRERGIPGYVYQPGCRPMKPWQALDYARQRMDLPQGGLDRDRHIAQLLEALAHTVTTSGVMGDAQKARTLLDAVGDTLFVDTGSASLTDLFATLRPLLDQKIVTIAMPFKYTTDAVGRSVLSADDRTDEFFAAVRADTVAGWLRDNPNYRDYSKLGNG
jgi:LCP family protein required for cell wall assembly